VKSDLSSRARKVLATLAGSASSENPARSAAASAHLDELAAADLAARGSDGRWRITAAGRAFLARERTHAAHGLDPFLAQHLDVAAGEVVGEHGRAQVVIDAGESPLAWLARRKGRDGAPLITPEQFLAGERLRAEFTRAQLTPRVTSNWGAVGAGRRRGSAAPANLADTVIAARQRVRMALDAAGPEFAGLLLDVCCFLKRLEQAEHERRWPARSAKVVLQLGLDRLARHYGYAGAACCRERGSVQAWLAPDAAFVVDGT
jgi:hypothetical protein